MTLTDVDVDMGIDSDEVRILKADAKVGGGTVDIRGAVPLRGLQITEGHATITARNVSLPVMEGVRSAADADLELAWQAASAGAAKRSLPKLTGDVTLTTFRYTRKVTMAADIDTLTKRGHRTHFESYDPLDDLPIWTSAFAPPARSESTIWSKRSSTSPIRPRIVRHESAIRLR